MYNTDVVDHFGRKYENNDEHIRNKENIDLFLAQLRERMLRDDVCNFRFTDEAIKGIDDEGKYDCLAMKLSLSFTTHSNAGSGITKRSREWTQTK